MLEGQKSTYDYLTNWSSPSLCRNSVLITENELHALVGNVVAVTNFNPKNNMVLTLSLLTVPSPKLIHFSKLQTG